VQWEYAICIDMTVKNQELGEHACSYHGVQQRNVVSAHDRPIPKIQKRDFAGVAGCCGQVREACLERSDIVGQLDLVQWFQLARPILGGVLGPFVNM
jgi:hypothetical protein